MEKTFDLEETKRAIRLALKARRKHVTMVMSDKKAARKPRTDASIAFKKGFKPGLFRLGFSTPAALGDAIRYSIVAAEERRAQHGPVKVIVQNGIPVSS